MSAERVAERTGVGRRSRRSGPPDVELCLVCGEATGRDEVRLCSRACVRSARRELEALAADDRDARLEHDQSPAAERARVLRAALIAWSPN